MPIETIEANPITPNQIVFLNCFFEIIKEIRSKAKSKMVRYKAVSKEISIKYQ